MRAVFFDLAGTLIEVDGGIGRQYARVAQGFGIEADPKAIDRAFPHAFSSAGPMVLNHPDVAEVASLERDFWKVVVRNIFEDVGLLDRFPRDQFDRYFQELFEYFETARPWLVYPDVVSALQSLKEKDFTLGLITNFDQRVYRLLDSLDLTRFFDSITIPALVGVSKPEREIFEYALRCHGLNAADATHVGDSAEDDARGAEAAGMRGVLIDRKKRHPNWAGNRIASLAELHI